MKQVTPAVSLVSDRHRLCLVHAVRCRVVIVHVGEDLRPVETRADPRRERRPACRRRSLRIRRGQPRRVAFRSVPGPWQHVTTTHADSWFGRVTRIPHHRGFSDTHYIDDHGLSQITAALPLIGLPRDQQLTLTRGDGSDITVDGLDDLQAMRMILLQVLTADVRARSERAITTVFPPPPITAPTPTELCRGSATLRARSTSHRTPFSSTVK